MTTSEPNGRTHTPRRQTALRTLAQSVLLLLAGCGTAPPEGVAPVKNFELHAYLGTWYEIARIDHSFERGLTHCQAEYATRPDGAVRVLNRGYDPARREWRQAEGVARFRGDLHTGSLRVSFFGPFYGGYHVLAWQTNAPAYAVVCSSRDYLWFLARERQLPAETIDQLLQQANGWGFDTNRLLFVPQTPPVTAR
jgi:apolipoprotein D and lipocalin family protein